MTTADSKRSVGSPPIIDEESEAIIHQGASLSQVCRIFGIDSRDVKAKLHGTEVKPVGTRRGHPVYAIRDVAPYLVSPPYDIDEFIQKMSIADLPTILRKEYWAGMRSRQLFEKEAAELWPTDQVIETVSSLLKTLRMSLLMTREATERETELTERQRAIITRIIDNALEDLHAKTKREFSKASSHPAQLQADTTADQEDL